MISHPRLVATILAIGSMASAQFQVVRNTTPPTPLNPAGYLLDPAGGPMVGSTWRPLVDETVFAPPPVAPALFFMGISLGPSPFDIPFASTFILIDVLPPNPIVTLGPVVGTGGPTPFPIPIPVQCSLIGTSLSTQAALVDGAASITLANAIDIIIGGGPTGLYSMGGDQPVLYRIDPSTGATLASVTINLPGIPIDWGNGLVKHPFTGELYAILKVTGGPAPPGSRKQPKQSANRPGSGASTPGPVTGRVLATICPFTGDAEFVLDLQDAFAALAFDQSGLLWGLVGDGTLTGAAAAPNTLNASHAGLVVHSVDADAQHWVLARVDHSLPQRSRPASWISARMRGTSQRIFHSG